MNLEKHIESEYNRFGLIAVLILLIGCLGGITLSAIASRNHTTVAALKRANSLSSDTIRVGQRLKIP